MDTIESTRIVDVERHAERTMNFAVETNVCAVAYVLEAMLNRVFSAFACQILHHYVNGIDFGDDRFTYKLMIISRNKVSNAFFILLYVFHFGLKLSIRWRFGCHTKCANRPYSRH